MRTLILICLLPLFCFPQTGINTDLPNDAAALELSSSLNSGFGGLKLPTITNAQKASIAVTPGSDGMILFVDYGSSRCLEIYDGISDNWQSIKCLTVGPVILYSEDFESYVTNTGISYDGGSMTTTDTGDYTTGTGVLQSGVSHWTLDAPHVDNSEDASYDKFLVTENYDSSTRLMANYVNGEASWLSKSIDISGMTNVSFSLDITGYGELEYQSSQHGTATRVNDYADVYYRIDGGSWIKIIDYNSNGTINHTLTAVYSTGGGRTNGSFPTETVTESGLSGTSLELKVTFQNWWTEEFIYLDNIEVIGN
ncbi:hypothetical protein [Nonlabens sp.]|uniref:hypothetical protein n=1 Tax=Nonlabens sp. TaxID=1888209 RepID=UPI0032676319